MIDLEREKVVSVHCGNGQQLKRGVKVDVTSEGLWVSCGPGCGDLRSYPSQEHGIRRDTKDMLWTPWTVLGPVSVTRTVLGLVKEFFQK